MADEDKTTPAPADSAEPSTNTSPAPTDVTEADPENPAGPPPGIGEGGPSLTAEPLTDGTIPTVLTTGSSAKPDKQSKSKRSQLGSTYRRADILSTLLTFIGTVVASTLIIGGYLYFTQNKKVAAPKVTTLDQTEVNKLSGFLTGTDAGVTTQVLTVSSSSLFKNRVAITSDLKVTGGLDVAGATNVADLTVNKTSTLGITNIRGNLNVSGPTVLQGPALLNGGASISGNLSATGNASFGGSISAGSINAKDLSVTGNINLSGHLIVNGQSPSAAPASEAGAGASASVDGNDTAGTVMINTGTLTPTVLSLGGLLVTVTYHTPYAKVPKVLITPIGSSTGNLPFYVIKTATGFTIGQNQNAKNSTAYAFDYWIVQ